MAVIIRMPEVLTGSMEASLLSWLVEPGDEIAIGQPIAEVETEKAIVEYGAEEAGTLAGTLVEPGASVAVGTPIAVLAGPGESRDAALAAAGATPMTVQPSPPIVALAPAASSSATQPAIPATERPNELPLPAPAQDQSATARRFASPLVRRLARERGLDISSVRGTGTNGRIVRRDLEGLAAPTPPVPTAATTPPVLAAAGPVGAAFTDIPHTGMRRAIARRLTESKSTIPHFYLEADCRVDALIALRRTVNEQNSTKVSLNDFVVKAAAAAFRDVPGANAIWTDGATRRFDQVDIAIAVAIEGGLVTPVLRGIDRRSLTDVSAEVADLAARGREGRLKQHELEGGSFAISNLGMYGIERFAAIISPPHSGILAVGAATARPVVVNGEVVAATVMSVTLSGDHRVLDGALAAQWLSAFVARIENPLTILI